MSSIWKWLVGILVLVIAIVVVAMQGRQGKDEFESMAPFKIGVASLMSGDFAVVGENIRDVALLVAEQINNDGGVNGRMLEIVTEDAKCDSKTGLSAVTKLATVDEIKYIIAGMCSNGTVASAPLANQQKVVMLTPVTGGENVDNAGEYVFRTANADVLAGRDLANAVNKLGHKNVAVVTETAEYALDIKESFFQTHLSQGGKVLVEEDYQPGTSDFRTVVNKIKLAKPEAVLVLSQTGISGAHFLKQARDRGLSIPTFTDFTLVANSDAKSIVGSFDGVYFADPAYDSDKPELEEFFNSYEAKYGHMPAIPFHAAATRDALYLIIQAVMNVGEDSEQVQEYLNTQIKDFNGFMGTYSLDEKGNSNLGFVIKVIKEGEPELVVF